MPLKASEKGAEYRTNKLVSDAAGVVLVDFDAWVTVLRTASPKLGTGEVRAIVHTIKPVRGHGAIDYRQADFATIVRLSFVEPKMW